MQIRTFSLLFLVTVFAACKKDSTTTASSGTDTPTPAGENGCIIQLAPENGSVISGRYIIALKDVVNSRTMSGREMNVMSAGILARNNVRAAALQNTFRGEPGGFIANLNASELKSLRVDPSVDLIEPDRVIALGSCFTVVEPRLLTWNVKRIGYGDGTGKTAWVIDSGIDFTHPDLNVDTTRSHSFLDGDPSANDANGHGTHVAGIIGAKNNNIGVLGVASGANLVSLRVLDKDGKGNVGALIEALAWVNTNAKAGDVVNISSGEDSISTILDRQVQNTAARGVYITIAAGNDGKPAINFSPGRANGTNIYTVSAIDSLDNLASFSNYGNDVVDYAAPGVRIISTFKDGKYAIASGTSMAAPHLAGLLLIVGPNIKTSGTAKNDPDGVPDPIAHD